MEIGINSAIIGFNDGMLGIGKVAERLGLTIRGFMNCHLFQQGKLSVKRATKKCSEVAIKRRKKLRAIRKRFIDEEKEQEVALSYKPGSF
eukprot:gene4951-5600_t